MKNKTVLRITVDAMFVALITVMSFVPYVGYIMIPPGISITTITIVVLIGAYLFGMIEGAIFGFTFGLLSLFKALTMPGTSDYIFVNPLISILPRVIFGFLAGLLFMIVKKKIDDQKTKVVLSSVISAFMSLLHTAMVVLMLWLFSQESQAVMNVLTMIFSLNCAIEIVLAIILVPAIAFPLIKAVPFISAFNMKKDKVFFDYKNGASFYETSCLDSLKSLVAVNSVYDELTSNAENPYGKGVSDAFKLIEDIARKEGFEKITNYSNRVLEIEYGEGERLVSIFAHTDVVPATGNWKHDPFEVLEEDNVLYGRGIIDDKGPLMASLYAMKLLKDNNLVTKDYRIRLVIGGDEERGSSCLKYYFEELKKEQPDFGFTPDGSFPVVYSEKGITNYKLSGNIDLSPIIQIKAGEANNIIIDNAIVRVKKDDELIRYLDEKNIDYSLMKNDDEYEISFIGKSAHGSTPELGANSGIIALKELGEFYKLETLTKIASLYADPSGKNLGGYAASKLGDTTYNVGIIDYLNNELSIVVNFRYPRDAKYPKLLNAIKTSSVLNFTILHESDPLYFSPQSKLVSTLMDVYRKYTGDLVHEPIAIGGGTYAKEAKNTVAFGSEFIGKNYHMHESNECYDKDEYLSTIGIYAQAIRSLGIK